MVPFTVEEENLICIQYNRYQRARRTDAEPITHKV